MTTSRPVGVLVMAHGTPQTLDDLENFYTEIRGGRAPGNDLLGELRRRYVAIGGRSPLAEITAAQVEGLKLSLSPTAGRVGSAGSAGRVRRSNSSGGAFVVELGYKFANPRIEDAVDTLQRAGAEQSVGIVLAPHSSVVSVGEYARRAEKAFSTTSPASKFGKAGVVHVIENWYRAAGLVELWSHRVERAIAELPEPAARDVCVVFSAHSVPLRVVKDGDSYAEQVQESADSVAANLGLETFDVAWQSAGRTPEPWLGPSLLDAIREHAEKG
ncbi:MAG TPA: ferrochelatase, partial [Acidimicrobiales bacterium]|nr:ferrochelatase [Acidimicrobiales bacterium]